MSRHPIQGVAGAKPKLPKAEANGEPTNKKEIAKLSEEYLRTRNRTQAAKAFMAETQAAKQRGELIELKWAFSSLSYLLVCLRQEVMSVPGAWAPRLAGLTVEEVTARLREMTHSWLTTVANLPEKVTNPDWLRELERENVGEPAGERQQSPTELKVKQSRATRRAEKKIASQQVRRGHG